MSRIYRTGGGIPFFVCFTKHFPEHFLLFVFVYIRNFKLLARSSIYIVESFHSSSCLRCFVRTANFGPTFFHDLHPEFASTIITSLSSFVIRFDFCFSEAKLLDTLFIDIKRKPIINYNLGGFSVNVKFYGINSKLIICVDKEIVSDSFSELHHLFFSWGVFGQTS